MYLEWLCTWWAVAPVSREHRRSLLPLLCLELSSIDEEVEFELEEKLAEETEALNKLLDECAAKGSNDTVRKDEKKEDSICALRLQKRQSVFQCRYPLSVGFVLYVYASGTH